MHGEDHRLRAGLIDGAALSLFFAPALHPLLRPWVGVPSHLLWSIHVLPVAWFAYRWGRSGAAAALPLSGALIIVGERLWGGGYGLAADWETAVALAVAVTATNVLIVGFALYARRAARRLYRSAYRDALTGLPNRRFLAGEVRRRLRRLHAGSSQLFAVLFIDLDDFKMVNDSLGHPAGDCVLRQVASRLRGCLQPEDTLARWAGDEFVVLVQDPTPAAAGDVVARRIQQTLAAPIGAGPVDVALNACVGIVVTRPGDSPERLLRDADTALHSAKSQGKGKRALFDHAMRDAVTARMALQSEMRAGIERGQFVNYYQPIHCTRTGAPQGLETLVRWRHPVRGLLGPDEFIGLAERSGQIAALGAMVLEQALTDLAQWQRLGQVVRGVFVAVNASPAQIMADGFFDQVEGACRRHRIDPHCLLLEITESLFMDGSTRMLATLRRLRQLGVRLAIDDFGSGYSSLGYLPRLPVDVLKIDQSLVGSLKARQPSAMVGPIIQIAHGLGLTVVAEGVEEPEQLRELRRSACDYVQGFLLSRPMPGAEVPGVLPGRGVTDDEDRLREVC